MALRRWIRNFFGFSRSQTNGFIVLLPLIGLFILAEPLKRWWQSRQVHDFSEERNLLDSLSALWLRSETNFIPEDNEITVTRFDFDPNLASAEELLALGFSQGLARQLINYRSKGGKFITKTDLLRLYNMDSAFYKSLEPFIALPEIKPQPLTERGSGPGVLPKFREPVKFDLNRADTTLLKTVYGIGPKLSSRIVIHRELLGGFISPDQLYSIYGLDSAVIEKLIKVSFIQEDFYPRKLNLNTATEEDLAIHPYISKRMARAVVTYRFQHGKYQSVDDLRKILQLDENQLTTIRPYLTVE